MKLQVALDIIDLKKALAVAKKVAPYVDIIELGTPLVKQHGLGAVKKFKVFRKPVVADLKTMDTGFFEAEMAYKSGANISTVCCSAGNVTIKGGVKAAKKYKKEIMVDLIGVSNVTKRVGEIKKLGMNYVCIHTGIDMQNAGSSPYENLKKVSKIIPSKKIAVAGGINMDTIDSVVKYKPGIIIVGGAITHAKDPAKAAKELREKIYGKRK